MWRMWSLLGILIGGFVLLGLVFWARQRSLMYLPSGHLGSPSDVGLANAEPVQLHTEDGLDLGGWFASSAAVSTRATIIVFNGNAGNRSYRGTLAARLAREGFGVLLFDYRGYGGNAGSPSEDGLVADARAARAYLTTRTNVDPHRVIYFGESLGAGVAVALALEQPPAVLILRSPFSSAVDVGRFHYPWLPVGLLLKDRFPSIERMPRITSPTLFIAGGRDRIVPASQTRALFKAARGPKDLFVLPDADHNDDALADGPQVIARISTFVDRVLK